MRYYEADEKRIKALELEETIINILRTKDVEIYDVFIAVNSSPDDIYYVSLEWGGSAEKYKRILGNYSGKAIQDFIKRLERN